MGGQVVNALAAAFKQVDTEARRAQGGTDAAANNIRRLGENSSGAAEKARGLAASVAGILGPIIGVTSAMALFSQSITAAFERGNAEQRLKNLTSSTHEYETALAVAGRSAETFGLSQTEATKALGDVYGRLKGVGFGLKETSQIYDGFNAIAKQSGLAAEEASGAFFQLSQALGKGKLNGDEFITVSERMPQLLDAIATATGKSRGELSAMAQDGKITSQVLYEALSSAAQAAGDLNAKLTPQQQAMNNLKQAADALFVAIGGVFAPVVIAGAAKFAEGMQAVADSMPQVAAYIQSLMGPLVAIGQILLPAVGEGFRLVIENIKVLAQIATFFGTFVGTLKAIAFVTDLYTKSVLALATAKKVAAVAAAALQTILNPANALKIAVALGAAAAASYGIGKAMDAAAEAAGGVKAETTDLGPGIDAALNKYSKLPPIVDDAKSAAKDLKAAQNEVTQAIQSSTQAADALAQTQATAVDQSLKLAQARLQAETAINNVLLEQAERQLQGAKTASDREVAARRIYDLTVENAANELRAAELQIEAETKKAQIQLDSARVKEREIQATVALAQAQGAVTAAHYEALAAQRAAVGLAEKALDTATAIAEEQGRAAKAVYDGRVAAAGAAYEQNRVLEATVGAASAAGQFASNMQSAASAAQSAASAMESASAAGSGGGRRTQSQGSFPVNTSWFGKAGSNAAFMEAFKAAKAEYDKKNMASSTASPIGMKNQEAFWDYWLKQATEFNQRSAQEAKQAAADAWNKIMPHSPIGKSGWRPPANERLDQAIAHYGGGQPSAQNNVPQTAEVNVEYNGTILRNNDGDFVKTTEVPNIVKTAVDKTLSVIRSDPQARRQAGVTR